MAYDTTELAPHHSPADLQILIDRLLDCDAPRFRRLWSYYRNTLTPRTPASDESGSEHPYQLAQEWGLPSRITGFIASQHSMTGTRVNDVARKEIVIENDISWRIDTMIDYLFGKPITLRSGAANSNRRNTLEQLAKSIIESNGGLVFLQQLSLLGAVNGFVDVLVKFCPPADAPSSANTQQFPLSNCCASSSEPAIDHDSPAASEPDHGWSDAMLGRIARCVRLEIVEPTRALPLLCPDDYRIVEAYVQVYTLPRPATSDSRPSTDGWLRRLFSRSDSIRPAEQTLVVDLINADRWQRYENEKLVGEGANSLGILPLVHIQNISLPLSYAGLSDVEPLVPLQDELNTRLSDRAHRITMQSFKMYLGKQIDNFTSLPVAPGRMWMTDNNDADVIEFGGDATCPSEDHHIEDIREAMDKISGVTPIAAGVVRDRIGNLTSAAALRVTLMALLSKTERKRRAYGQGIQKMLELAFAWLDHAGLFKTTAGERAFDLTWTTPLPDNQTETLQDAEAKLRIGVSKETVLKELGY